MEAWLGPLFATPSISRGVGAFGTLEIEKMKLPPDDAFAARHTQGCVKDGARIAKRMELPALPAWIRGRGQVVQELHVQLPAKEAGVELLRVDASDDRADPAGDHLSRERRSSL